MVGCAIRQQNAIDRHYNLYNIRLIRELNIHGLFVRVF
nr:MAG TPA: hypothetical protein [Caudoviricetes sp.]